MTTTLISDLKSAKGTVLPAGSTVEVEFTANRSSIVWFRLGEQRVGTSIVRAHRYSRAFKPAPSINTLERWNESGTCKTALGHTVEPDGVDASGCPSWLLVMGMI